MGNCCMSIEGYDVDIYDRESAENERKGRKNDWRTGNDYLRCGVQLLFSVHRDQFSNKKRKEEKKKKS